jgi:uncharacterized protein YjbJ (UPF0337 family)
MSEPSKISGNVKQTTGAVKENLGKVIGSDRMQAEGAAKRAEGKTEHEAAAAKQYGEGAADSMMGGLKHGVGKVLGNEQMQAEGKAREAKGDVKKATA